MSEKEVKDKKTLLPPWKKPEGFNTGLIVRNTMTLNDDELITVEKGNVKMYTCGPTVYDYSHLGHARTYMGVDIMRRIIEDYFQIPISFVVNVTDIDDKIIKKANHVLVRKLMDGVEKFLKNESDKKSFAVFREALDIDEKSVEKAKRLSLKQLVSFTNYLKDFLTHLQAEGKTGDQDGKELLDLQPNANFVSRKFERLFWEDMAKLDVRSPTVITRVTEYVDEIVKFVEKIIANGYAYESEGSVYFDVAAYSKKYVYGKLEPWSVGDLKLASEGEEEWAKPVQKPVEEEEETETTFDAFEKKISGLFPVKLAKGEVAQSVIKRKSPRDFALWKKSNPGEPMYPSPWGLGRPGWHIECSVMSQSILGTPFDIHSGGIDLAFPHHENEIAQSVAYNDEDDWVRYFLHCGHLNIEGEKMSKSLKNFTIIRDALKRYNSKEIRLLFLSNHFFSPLDYSVQTMEDARKKFEIFNTFFQNLDVKIRESKIDVVEKWGDEEWDLYKFHQNMVVAVDKALRSNFNTKEVLKLFLQMRSKVYKYLSVKPDDYKVPILKEIGEYMTKIFRIFGLVDANSIGFGSSGLAGEGEKRRDALVDIITKFRDTVRVEAKKTKAFGLLKECDKLRDEVMPLQGIKIEDNPNNVASWKKDSIENILMQIEAEKRLQDEKRKKKEEKKKMQKKKAVVKEIVDPKIMFSSKKEYEGFKFDENGIPIQDKDGKNVAKSKKKKLMKMWKTQNKKYQKFLKKK